MLFTCNACTAFTEWLTYLCFRLQPPLPSSNFPKALSNYIPLAGAEAGMSFLSLLLCSEWQPCSVYITALMVWLQPQEGCGIFFLPEPQSISPLPRPWSSSSPWHSLSWHCCGGNLFSSWSESRDRCKASLLGRGKAAINPVHWWG